ncbi:hypothetical protein EII17_12385 [Clostridiales bacterium COT073_COT-073]|nr:hypothetical protein EII17_12385 [Clostridiales bacterium COT073_COT-073]
MIDSFTEMEEKMKKYKRKLAALLACSLLWSNSVQGLSDIEGHWAQQTILSLQSQGYISGYQNGTFLPDKEISRAEFIATLNKMMGFREKADILFSDVKPEDWFWNEVAIAVSAGYVKGYEDGTFRPEEKISRLEAAVFLARAMKLPLTQNPSKRASELKDLDLLPNWAKAEVIAVVSAGVMKGYENNTFQGMRQISRAEAVVSMERSQLAYQEQSKELASKQGEDKKPIAQQPEKAKPKASIPSMPSAPSVNGPSAPSTPSAPSAPSKPEMPSEPKEMEKPAPSQPETPPAVPTPPKVEENKPKENTPEEKKPEENKPKENTPEENKPKENTPEENKPKENTPGENKPKEDKPEGKNPEENKPKPPKKPKPHKPSNPAAINLQEILNRGVNQNLTTYEKEGQTRRILWVKGINPPKMGENGDFREEKIGEFIDYKADYVAGNHWFDVNKTIDGGNTEIDRYLCYGAVSSNMLHWWLDQNAEYVSRFIEQQTNKGKFPENLAPLRDIRKFVNSFKSQQESLIFDYYRVDYGGRKNGFYADLLLDLFINGFAPSEKGATNNDRELTKPDSRGGFFYEVFGSEILTDRRYSPDYNNFGKVIANILAKGEIIGLEHQTAAKYTSHIVTLWGAEYDEQGLITGIYISDSDDQNEGRNVGMKRYNVRNVNGKPKISSNVVNKNAGSELYYLHVLSLAKDRWEEYFQAQTTAEEVSLPENQDMEGKELIEKSELPENSESAKSDSEAAKMEAPDQDISEEAKAAVPTSPTQEIGEETIEVIEAADPSISEDSVPISEKDTEKTEQLAQEITAQTE